MRTDEQKLGMKSITETTEYTMSNPGSFLITTGERNRTNYSVPNFMGYLKSKPAFINIRQTHHLKYKFDNRHFWFEK